MIYLKDLINLDQGGQQASIHTSAIVYPFLLMFAETSMKVCCQTDKTISEVRIQLFIFDALDFQVK